MYFNGQSVDVDCQQSRHYYDNSYIKKMTQRDYLDYCEKDRKRRNDFSQQLPELTLEKYAGLFGRIDNIPLCQIGFVVNTNKLIHVANLRVELILKMMLELVTKEWSLFLLWVSILWVLNRVWGILLSRWDIS